MDTSLMPERPRIKSLEQGYIFYEDLSNHPETLANGVTGVDLYQSALEGVKKYADFYKRANQNPVAQKLLRMARAELDKEQSALNNLFGVDLNIDLADEAQIKSLIIAFNSTLNLKTAFERNVKRIKNTESKRQINIASFFDSYFMKTWEENEETILKTIKGYLKHKMSIQESISLTFDKLLPDLVKQTLYKMFSSKVEDNDTETQTGYEQLLEALDSAPAETDALVGRLIQAYKLDNLKESLQENYSKILHARKNKDKYFKDTAAFIKNNRYSKGGFTLEYLENFIGSLLLSNTISNDNHITVKGAALHTGALHEMKADNIFAFNIDLGAIERAFEDFNNTTIGRENNIQVIESMTEQVKNIKDGYIIYSSAKNYTMGGDSKGFSAGAPISVNTLTNITGNTSKMGAILQTAQGAVGERYYEDIRLSVAEDIAYYLFDDISTIGTNENPAKALHLFDLDGIYIPLSTLLYKIGRAVEETQRVPTNLINVSIHTDPILFADQSEYTMEEWNEQREHALDTTTIDAHFFKDFFNFIKEF